MIQHEVKDSSAMTDSQNKLEILRSARKLIEKPKNWSCGGWGGRERRCMVHALRSALEASGLEEVTGLEVSRHPAYKALHRATGMNMGPFNDTHTHAEVLAVYDRAIAEAEAEITILSDPIFLEDPVLA